MTAETIPYVIGQSVVAKVTEVDQEKQRFLLSLRMADCYHGDADVALKLLESYLREFQFLRNLYNAGDY